MPPYKAKKRLGQNFLVDKQIAGRIVDSLDPKTGENIVEIGPGRGALTELLLARGCRVTAVEFDRDLIPGLESKFGKSQRFRLLGKDILKVSPEELPSTMKIIGNLPYNISTAIMERLYLYKASLMQAVFTVQMEVAERLTADIGGSSYGSFTLIIQTSFQVERLFNIAPPAFRPKPAVTSTVIRLRPQDNEPGEFEKFKLFLRGCFRQKRKTLANSMQIGLDLPKTTCEGLIGEAGFDLAIRPEQLTLENYISIYNLWRIA